MSKIRKKLAEIIGCKPEELTNKCRAGSHPLWDSLVQVKIILWLEADYDFKISDETIEKLVTVKDIERFINEH